jgi:hypothetical protein
MHSPSEQAVTSTVEVCSFVCVVCGVFFALFCAVLRSYSSSCFVAPLSLSLSISPHPTPHSMRHSGIPFFGYYPGAKAVTSLLKVAANLAPQSLLPGKTEYPFPV